VEVQDVDVVALAGPAARHVAAGSAVRAAAAHDRRWAAGRADVKQPAGRELAVGEAVRGAALQRGGEDGRGATHVHAVRVQGADRLVARVEQPLAGEHAVACSEPVVLLRALLVDEVDRLHALPHGDVAWACRLRLGEGGNGNGSGGEQRDGG